FDHPIAGDVARQLDYPRHDRPLPVLKLDVAVDAHADGGRGLLGCLEHRVSPAAKLGGDRLSRPSYSSASAIAVTGPAISVNRTGSGIGQRPGAQLLARSAGLRAWRIAEAMPV